MQFDTFCLAGDSLNHHNPTTSQSCGILSDTNDHEVKVKTVPIDNEPVINTNDREVKVKTKPVDNEPVEIQLPQNNDKTWVKVRDLSLTYHDKDILERGEKLSDKHINLAQRILKTKFRNINGLRLTLLQDKFHKEPTKNALQIIHTGGDHCICVPDFLNPMIETQKKHAHDPMWL